MSVSLEQTVRPFVIRPINSGKRIVISTETSDDDAILVWGGVGTLPKAFSTLIGTELCKEVLEEVSRTEVEKRIENPDDSSQYAKVKRVTKMQLKKTEDKSVIKDSSTAWVNESTGDPRDSFDPPGGQKTGCDTNWQFSNPK